MIERTLTIFKPDAVGRGVYGAMLQRLLDEGFSVRALRMVRLTRPQAEGFYEVHSARPFFGELVEFMTSGPAVAACLERENAVAHLRAVMGPTDCTKAPADTIRGKFGTTIQNNAIHGSDSPENAAREIAFFFTEAELRQIGVAAGPRPEAPPAPHVPAGALHRPPRRHGR